MHESVQQFDMGYFGDAHESYGIVLFIDTKQDVLHVLDITDRKNKKTIMIHRDSFVHVRNLKDMAIELEQEHCSVQANKKWIAANFVAEVKVIPKRNIGEILYNAKQTYTKDVIRANPSYKEQREQIILNLITMAEYERECLAEVEQLIDSQFDYNHRIVTIKPSKSNQVFHLTLSVIGKDIIIHNASIRYDSLSIFKQLKEVTSIAANHASGGLLGTA